MKKNHAGKWIVVALVAALVAAGTTVLILVLRARAKKKCFDDAELCYSFDEDELEELDADFEPVEETDE